MRTVVERVLRHKLFVVVAWLALAVGGAATASHTVSRLTDTYAMPGEPSFTANNQILGLYGTGGGQEPIVPVVTVAQGESVRDADVRAQLDAVLGAARKSGAVRIVDYADTGDDAFVTRDGRSTFALIFTAPNDKQDGLSDRDRAVADAVSAAAPAGWTVRVTGMRELINAAPPKKGAGVIAESMIGALGALIVLLFVFASLLVVLPLIVAAVSILTTFLLLGGLTAVADVSFIVEYLVALIGLGVAIDYSLLVLTRWREERSRGADREQAVVVAMCAAGRSVVFSGLTVAVALLALVVLRIPFLRSIGYAGVLVPLVSTAVAVTLLPVLLATVGPRLEWPRRRTEASAGRVWRAWACFVQRRRVIAAVVGVAVLVALAIPLLSLRLGEPRTSTLAKAGDARVALDTLTDGGVPAGVLTPIEVLVKGDPVATTAKLAAVKGVLTTASPNTPGFRRDGTAVVDVLPVAEAGQGAGRATVRAVRAALVGDPEAIGVGGVGAQSIDAVHAIYGSFPLMLTLIAIVTFLLLARALRSVLLALKAVLVNLLSVAAAYGVLVLVWQGGHGSNTVWGVASTGVITFWVPVFVFAFLFGLSMDYEVFILTRIREGYDRTGSTALATVEGLARTGRLVTSAALILAFAFLAMSTGPQTDMKILATGLGAGIVVDAFVVRTLVVPALVALFGRWNWWLPAALARLLRVAPSAAMEEPSAVPSSTIPSQPVGGSRVPG
ncbi:MAG TPA: MMPL family transporter [Acidothermaceae bacterium]